MSTSAPRVPRLRSATSEDVERLHVLNQASVPHVGSISQQEMQWFADHASHFRVAELAGEIAGLLIGLTPEVDYGSPNFRWFQANYPSFVYIDRIAVDPSVHRAGVGAALYDDIELYAHGYAPMLACEVNLRPPNPVSVAFHQARGFRQVGTAQYENGTKEVCFMVKDVPVR